MKKMNPLVLLVLLALALAIILLALLAFLRSRPPAVAAPDVVPVSSAVEQPAIPQPSSVSDDDLQLAQVKSNRVQKVLSGNGRSISYTQELATGDVIVGHASRYQRTSGSAVFLMTGPGLFEFSISSGLWNKYTNTTPRVNEALLQEQVDIMVNKYHVKPESLKIHRLDGATSK